MSPAITITAGPRISTSLSRGGFARLPLLDRVAAHHARMARRRRTARARFLRPAGRRACSRAASRRGSASIIGICRRRLQDKGGWLNRDIAVTIRRLRRASSRKRLGDRVKHWATFNEPNIHALVRLRHGRTRARPQRPAQYARGHPSPESRARPRASQALRAERADFRIGTVVSLQPARPASDQRRGSPRRRAVRRDVERRLPRSADAGLAIPRPVADDFAPLVMADDLATIHQPLDLSA